MKTVTVLTLQIPPELQKQTLGSQQLLGYRVIFDHGPNRWQGSFRQRSSVNVHWIPVELVIETTPPPPVR